MKVQIIKSYRGDLSDKRQFVPGDVWTVEEEQAQALIKLGVAKEALAALPKSDAIPAPAPVRITPKPVVMVDDPADHSVAEVAAYVAAYPAEADRILEAEAAGQNRSTLVRALRTMKGPAR